MSSPRTSVAGTATFLLVAALACRPALSDRPTRAEQTAGGRQLPTGAVLDPAGRNFDVGSMPLNLLATPDADRAVLVLSGWREQGIQVIQPSTGTVLQTLIAPAAFIGAAFAPDGRMLYVSGGNEDLVYRYRWQDGAATLADSILLAAKAPGAAGTRYPAGLAFSPDGATMYVAENLADSLAVVRVADGAVVQRLPSGRYPYAVAVAPDGAAYVSAWGASEVRAFTPAPGGEARGRLRPAATIPVGRHPSALLLNRAGNRLFVASGSTDRVTVLDLERRTVVAQLLDPPPAGPNEGSTPNALALSDDGARLFVAEADNNAVAVFDLSPQTSGARTGAGTDRLVGRVPVGWYPTGIIAYGDTLLVANGKGRGTAPNAEFGPQPGGPRNPRGYTLGQLSGTVSVVPVARARPAELIGLTERVVAANHWDTRRSTAAYPPFEHVIYVIKENRTYDQVFGDLPQGDGDTSLVFFPRPVSPNHHALAERFGLFDRFLVNAEVSPDGHNWSMAAYTTDYLQKTVPSNYSSRGRSYDYEGTNRGAMPPDGDDAAAPAGGYLWDLAERKGITFRNYGEFVLPEAAEPGDPTPPGYRGNKPFLEANTVRNFPGYDLQIQDQLRADVWIRDLNENVRRGTMPALQIVRLPNDHTEGARSGRPTPRAHMADNDLALGRMIEALSRTPFWRNTVVFVLEDDSQNGPDHVDSHRSVLLVVSAYSRGGVIHRFTNTTDVLVTMEEILGLEQLSQFDYYGRPLRDVWRDTPDLTPYAALTPAVSLTELNPADGPGARESEELNFLFEDVAGDDAFNRVLWAAIKGDTPYPGIRRMAALEWKRSR